MTTLITGATGFVGSAVARKLVASGHEVRSLVRPHSDRRNLVGVHVTPVVGDLNDPQSLKNAVAGCDCLFHIAADYRLWAPRPREIYETNVTGTKDLMRAALGAGVSRIVYTSSVATLGILPNGESANETTSVALSHMIGHYKRSKFLAEEAVKTMVREEGLPAVIVNPSTPVGPRDIKPTPTGQMIRKSALNKMPAYVDTGLNIVHVDDVAEGHLLAYEKGKTGERYILGGENLSLRRILEEIAIGTGNRPPKIRLSCSLVLPIAYLAEAWTRLSRSREPFVTIDGVRMARKQMYFSSTRAMKELGYNPRPAVDALRDAVQWFLANPAPAPA